MQRLGLQADWLTATNFKRPPPSNPGNGGNFPGGGGGGMNYPTLDSKLAKEESADSFGIKDPQAINSYFKERSQFGVPANVQGPPPQDFQNLPPVNLNPDSLVSKSVLSIEASYDKVIDYQVDDLRLPGENNNNNNSNNGLDKYKIDPNSQPQNIGNTNDFLNDLENLKLDESKEQQKDENLENQVKKAAQKSFIQHSQSNLNPFQPPEEQASFQKPGKISNLAFSNFNNNDPGFGNYTENNDKTIQDVNLPSFARDNYGNDPSLNLGGKKPTLEKAPEKLPLNRSYNPDMPYNKELAMMESYGIIFYFINFFN